MALIFTNRRRNAVDPGVSARRSSRHLLMAIIFLLLGSLFISFYTILDSTTSNSVIPVERFALDYTNADPPRPILSHTPSFDTKLGREVKQDDNVVPPNLPTNINRSNITHSGPDPFKNKVSTFENATSSFVESTHRLPRATANKNNIDDDQHRFMGLKYLLYYSHSGFSNQLLAMDGAAQLAVATNRTLVLPPVFPHVTFQEDLLYPEFPYLTAGTWTKCEPYRRYDEFIDRIELDVQKASSPKISFPSFKELFAFDDIFIKTGLQVIDMKDFAKVVENTNVRSWCSGRGNNTMRNMMVPQCKESDGLEFTELIPKFENICNGKKIAAIGSAYVIPKPKWDSSRQVQTTFHYFREKLTPSEKIMQLLKEIHSRLPDNYYGVAIRFRDRLKVNDCDSKVIRESFQRVLHSFSTKKKNNGKNGPVFSANSTHHILIGDGNKAALKCLRYHTQGEYTVSTVRDIVHGDEALKSMVDKIKSEKSTIYTLLDQILIALAEEVAFEKVGHNIVSTFHERIKLWRKQKNRILGKMQDVN